MASAAIDMTDRVCPSPASSSVGDLVCAAFPRPRVALFLVGAARTFAQPLLHRTLRTNLIEAFGGEVTLFALIKLLDERGDTNKKANALIEPPESAVRAAIDHLIAAVNVKRSHIVIGGAALQPACWPGSYHPSLLGQAALRFESWRMLLADEATQQQQHDLILYKRPDVAWLQAIQPYCFWEVDAKAKLWDWVWLLPRRDAESFFNAPTRRIASRCSNSSASLVALLSINGTLSGTLTTTTRANHANERFQPTESFMYKCTSADNARAATGDTHKDGH